MTKDMIGTAGNWISSLIGIVIGWLVLSLLLPDGVVPNPWEVFGLLARAPMRHLSNLTRTGIEALAGLLLASLAALAIVLLIAKFPRMEQLSYPYLVIAKTSPAVAFIPIFIVIVGSGMLSKILVSALIAFFPMVIGGIDGLKTVPERHKRLAATYGATPWRAFLNIFRPYMTVGLLTGMKTAAPLSVVGALVGEYVAGGSSVGLGTFIISNSANNLAAEVYAGVVLTSALGFAMFGAISLLHRVIRAGYRLEQ